METIVDIHSHMLPGLDDGSPNTETSVKMLSAAREQGVTIQVLTPHFYRWKEDIPSFVSRRSESCRHLARGFTDEAPRLLVGSETAFFPHMSRHDLSPLCIAGTRVLLLEMPFETWDNAVAEEIAALSLDRGYEVVLAHIERFLGYRGNAEKLKSLAKLPIHMQVNAEAFLSFTTRARALKLLESGMATLLGSDAHNLTNRRPNLGPARAVIEKKLGRQMLSRLDGKSQTLLREAIET